MPCAACGGRGENRESKVESSGGGNSPPSTLHLPPSPCPHCHGAGWTPFTGCPSAFVQEPTGGPIDIWDLIEAANMADKGVWPMGGGTQDQTQAFYDGAREWWRQSRKWQSKR